jgi:protein TonB
LPPRTIASETRVAATEEVAEVLAETAPAPQAEDKGKAESTEVMAALAPPPPLPRRKPVQEAPAAREAALPAPKPEKPAAPQGPRTAVAQQPVAQPETTQTSGVYGPWRPMALAPADKPVVSQVPTARPSGAAYSKMVWSALARHKPRAGQSGSTTVVFAIGATGMLGELRVGRSSGNARIDQLALATVRGAAPFPPPPGGSASFSIRIDLR